MTTGPSTSVQHCRPGPTGVESKIECIQPGNPQQNAYLERFDCTLRYEWLAQYLFDTVGEV